MGIKVTMTDKEAASSSRDALPAGKYLVAVTDGSLKACGSEAKNPGKPYYNIELTVQEENGGGFAGRKLFTNVMCFSPALYSMVQMLKASGVEVAPNGDFHVPEHDENEIPELDWFMGKIYVVKVAIEPAKVINGKSYDERNEIKSWFAESTWKGPLPTPAAGSRSSQGNSLLPK